MIDSEREQFSNAVFGLATTLGVEFSVGRAEGYFHALKDLPLETVLAAVENALRTWSSGNSFGNRMPLPGDLRELAGASTRTDHRAVEAWAIVRAAIPRIGAYRSIRCADPAMAAAIRELGGWVNLCRRDELELDQFVAKDFQRAYQALSASGSLPNALDAQANTLAGELAAPTGKGTVPAEPVLIGSERDVARVGRQLAPLQIIAGGKQ